MFSSECKEIYSETGLHSGEMTCIFQQKQNSEGRGKASRNKEGFKMNGKLKLGVNIDHVATLRQARLGVYPSPLEAAKICEAAGADGITAHLREDRRHIQDADMEALVQTVRKLNMEMAATDEMVAIAERLKPANCCLVPEKRRELTTEGGLDVVGAFDSLKNAVKRLQAAGVCVSIFIDPVREQLKAAAETGAQFVELHTGAFSNAEGDAQLRELDRLIDGAEYAHSLGLNVNAGHGIGYQNVKLVLKVPHLHELNIGHSIVSRAVFVGLRSAVQEMMNLMKEY